ncbi:MAG: hypothetical protein IPP59_03805 [Betaproteobacteria bacterium]|nr:hypothetical protein [Betaproteobacteria bacterium]MBK9783374.1 hypothetical protein [Candidatus Dechloromonas phosphorivorans]
MDGDGTWGCGSLAPHFLAIAWSASSSPFIAGSIGSSLFDGAALDSSFSDELVEEDVSFGPKLI